MSPNAEKARTSALLKRYLIPLMCFVGGAGSAFGLTKAQDVISLSYDTARAPIQAPQVTQTLASIDQASTCHSLSRMNIK